MRKTVVIVGGLVVIAAILVLVLAPWRWPSGREDVADSAESMGSREPTDSVEPAETSPENGVSEERPVEPEDGEKPDTPQQPEEPRQRVPKDVVAGRVVDESGKPIAAAEVAVLMSRHVQARDEEGTLKPRRREDLFETVLETSDDGEFEVSGLPSVETVPSEEARSKPDAVTCILVVQKAGYRMIWRDVRPGEYELRIVLEETVAFVSGRVIARESGEPLGGARIECRSAEATSDADGWFRIRVPVEVDPPQSIRASVLCYSREPYYAPEELRDVRLVQGEEVKGLLFELDRGTASIEGTIIEGQTRELVTGMQVRLYERDRSRRYYFPDEARAEVVADAADGTFVFEGLRAGTYQLEAIHYDWNCVIGRNQVAVEEKAEPHEVEVSVNTTSLCVITGTITSPTGEPIEGAAVWLIGANRVVMHQPASSNTEGRYGLQTDDGPSERRLRVMVFHPGYELKIVPVGSEDQHPIYLDVALSEAAQLAGVVTDGEGKPLKDVTITVEGEALGPTISAYHSYLPNPRAAFTTGADGAYAFTHLPPGEYLVAAAHENYAFAEQTVEIMAGVDRRCDFTLDPGVTIQGTVYDEHGDPLRVRSVVAVGPRGREHDSTVSAVDGRFTLRTLPRDDLVDVLVLTDQVDVRRDESFYYAKVEGVEPGCDDLRINARRIHLGTVEIEVIEAVTSEPVARYNVSCSWQPRTGLDGLARRFVCGPSYGRAGVTDEKGRAALGRLVPGTHRFTVRAEGFKAATSKPVEVTGGGTAGVRVELKRFMGNE